MKKDPATIENIMKAEGESKLWNRRLQNRNNETADAEKFSRDEKSNSRTSDKKSEMTFDFNGNRSWKYQKQQFLWMKNALSNSTKENKSH